jgi:hypothetical protein
VGADRQHDVASGIKGRLPVGRVPRVERVELEIRDRVRLGDRRAVGHLAQVVDGRAGLRVRHGEHVLKLLETRVVEALPPSGTLPALPREVEHLELLRDDDVRVSSVGFVARNVVQANHSVLVVVVSRG